jgi:hypothetical protein
MLMIRKGLMRLYYNLRKKVDTRYNGEFGYELISVIPFANWLQKQGKLDKTYSAVDTKCLYYFSKNHNEVYKNRNYVIPKNFPINNIHRRFLNTFTMWSPPDYKAQFSNTKFIYDKPICIICNKYNSEWGFSPITYLSIEVLEILFKTLMPHYKIIYCRPISTEISQDNSAIYNLKEHNWIRKHYPEVSLIQDIHNQNPDLTFNELQLMLFANANHFISTQGGYSILCSYFKGTNIIYGAKSKNKTALDIIYKTYSRWYHRFSGARICYASNYDSLINQVSLKFLNKLK